MRVWTLVACGALLWPAAPAAAQISVSGIRDLAFGPVIIGIPSTVGPADAVRSGQYRFTAPAGSRVRIDFDLPNQLTGPASAKLPIKFGKTDAIIIGNSAGSVPIVLDPNPKANQKYDMGTNTAANIFLGGTVTPAATQAPGSYVATIVLTVTIQ
jgi:hypothetical protein